MTSVGASFAGGYYPSPRPENSMDRPAAARSRASSLGRGSASVRRPSQRRSLGILAAILGLWFRPWLPGEALGLRWSGADQRGLVEGGSAGRCDIW
jgi:hypothetical protein